MTARILMIVSGAPNLRWGGGARRTYQLLYELRSVFGEDAVATVESRELDPAPSAFPQWLRRKSHRALAKVSDFVDNPLEKISRGGYGYSRYLRHIEPHYRRLLDRYPGLQVCIFEHFDFAHFVGVNRSLGLKTVLAPWGITSLLTNLPYVVPALAAVRAGRGSRRDRLKVRSAGMHFANEMLLNATADRSWFLSRLEAGLCHGLGLGATYMPYYAAGEAAAELEAIKVRREQTERRAGLFLVTGGNIDQNRFSLDVLVQRLAGERLPAEAKIVILGAQTPPVGYDAARWPQIEFRGFVPQEEYDLLLSQATGVLVPQVCGFGCLTRIVEMAAAGVPVIADAMAEDATGEIPGVRYIRPHESWSDAIHATMTQTQIHDRAAFEDWLRVSQAVVRQEISTLLIS